MEFFISLVVLVKVLVATIQAGSRAIYLLDKGSIGAVDGPLILPPPKNETSFLWDVSTAFRRSVELSIDSEVQDAAKAVWTRGNILPEPSQKPYSLSSFAVIEDRKVDKTILSEVEEPVEAETTDPSSALQGSLQAEQAVEVLPPEKKRTTTRNLSSSRLWASLKKSSTHTISFPRSMLQRVQCMWKQNEDQEEGAFPIDLALDFSLALSAEYFIGEPTTDDRERFVRVSAYAPDYFADLRSHFGITEESFRKSMLQSGPFVSFQSNSKGAARVGGVFFLTRDGNYMIKTIKQDEVRTLLEMLPKYYQFMKRNGKRSLLTRMCGLHEVELRDVGSGKVSRHVFVVMNSVFPAEASELISERFDLKGSTVGRECSAEELSAKGSNAVLKDLDLAREVDLVQSLQRKGATELEGYGFHIGPTAKAALLSQIRRDLGLLVDCQVIDYSLLVGVASLDSHKFSRQDLVALDRSNDQELRMELARQGDVAGMVLAAFITPARILIAPSVFLSRMIWSILKQTVSWPRPYYGSGECGVDPGRFGHHRGERLGHEAVFYFGLIDFLQPFNFKKVVEWKVKGLIYKEGFSCVPPEEYASRFLTFIERHIT